MLVVASKRCKVVAKRGEGLFLACVSGQCWAIRSQMAASERVPRLLSLCLFFLLLFEPGTGTEERGGGVRGGLALGGVSEPLREKRVHVSEFCPVGGAVVFMREEKKLR